MLLLRSPERAVVANLDIAVAVARNALRAAHPQLACEPDGRPLDRAVRRLLRRLDALGLALDDYARADDASDPNDDDLF
jgi:hypothetical protein